MKNLPLLVLILTSPALASDVLVVDSSSTTGFLTIQSAVDAALEGDVVLVRDGVYAESVVIAGMGVSVIGDGNVHVDGAIAIRDVPLGSFVLLGGIDATAPLDASLPGVHIDRCQGPVRLMDCEIVGSSDVALTSVTDPTGEGALIEDSADVALVDSQLSGGDGGIYAGFVSPAGYLGAPGVRAQGIGRLSIVRCVSAGGDGMWNIFSVGQDGGDGASVTDCPNTWIGYSAFIGGTGGDGDAFPSAISGDGGDGFSSGGNTEVWDLGGVFIAGFEGCFSGSFCVPGEPGEMISGSAPMNSLEGFPTRLNSPLLVRTGETFTTQVVSVAGRSVRSITGSSTRASFRPAGHQPLLVSRPAAQTFSPIGTIPANSRLDLTYTAGPIPGGADAQVLWIQTTVEEPNGARRLSSPRAMVVINSAF